MNFIFHEPLKNTTFVTHRHTVKGTTSLIHETTNNLSESCWLKDGASCRNRTDDRRFTKVKSFSFKFIKLLRFIGKHRKGVTHRRKALASKIGTYMAMVPTLWHQPLVQLRRFHLGKVSCQALLFDFERFPSLAILGSRATS